MIGLLAYGAYIPRLRLQRAAVFDANKWFNPGLAALAKGERSMASWDEDSVTMAVEAARDCLTSIDRNAVSSVILASTTLPFADRQNAGIVKEALNLKDTVGSMDVSGGQRAGTSSLIQALAVAASSDRRILCIASEKAKAPSSSEAELMNGDAAVGFLIGAGDEVIAKFLGSHSVTVDFVDHYRDSEREFDYYWESRWIRDEGYMKIAAGAIKDGIKALGIQPSHIRHFAAAIPAKGVPASLAKMVGVAPEAVVDSLSNNVGHSGVAHAGLMLSAAIENAKLGDTILVVSFGQGCDVLLFEVTERATSQPVRLGVAGSISRRKPEFNYMKYLAFNELIKMEKGMRAEADSKQSLTALYRSRKTVLGLVGGRCRETGTVQFPKTEISVNPEVSAVGTQEDYPLAERRCKILTYTADQLTYTLDPPAYYGMVEFDGGGRMGAEFVDVEPEDVAVGREMQMMFRIKHVDKARGFKRYFWKAAPVR
jgi:hydroxymethylglutaryl-CoA synthase